MSTITGHVTLVADQTSLLNKKPAAMKPKKAKKGKVPAGVK